MKTKILTFFLILISTFTFACSCDWGGNFIRVAKNAELIIIAKVVSRNFHLENGKTFSTLEETISETMKLKYKTAPDYFESINLEIISIIKGNESRKTIKIFASDGADCRSGVREFELNKTYILTPSLSKYSLFDMPNEKETDYFLWGCSETSIEYEPNSNKVYGQIKGRSSRKKEIEYGYEKLMKKISPKKKTK